MNKIVKIIVEILLALAAVGCVYGIYRSIGLRLWHLPQHHEAG